MDYIYFNPNPNAKTFKSGKPKSWHVQDDVVRAVCKVFDKSWIESYKLLDEIAKKNFTTINDKNVVDILLSTQNNFSYFTYGKPSSGQKRPVIKDFIKENSKGTYIIYLRDYYVAVIDGIVYDIQNLDNEAIYSYWKKL